MKSKDVYQADPAGFFLYKTTAYELALAPGKFNVPNLAYEDAPPVAGPGMVARRTAEGGWQLVEDHRTDILYYLKTAASDEEEAIFEQYQIGTEIEIDGEQVSYDGSGPLPDWLTDIAPEPAQDPQLQIE